MHVHTVLPCRLIRDSAPLVNMVIILGCILMLITAIMLGIDTQTPDIRTSAMEYINHRYTVFCNVSSTLQKHTDKTRNSTRFIGKICLRISLTIINSKCQCTSCVSPCSCGCGSSLWASLSPLVLSLPRLLKSIVSTRTRVSRKR